MADGLEPRVLGPLAAARDGHPIDLGGVRQRALPAALIVAHPHSVSAERLLDQVWHDIDRPKISSLYFPISTSPRSSPAHWIRGDRDGAVGHRRR